MELLRFIETLRTPFGDAVFGLITRLGEETIGILILCALFWCINKGIAYGIGVVYFIAGLTVQGLKICFRIDRPWILDPDFKPVPSAMEHATGYSFPSGHTQSAASLFGSLWAQLKQKYIRAACLIAALLVAFSRLYLGVHTLLDVSVSLLLSFLFIAVVAKWIDPHTKPGDSGGGTQSAEPGARSRYIKRLLITSLLMILYAIIVIIVAAALYANGIIERAYVTDCLKAAGAGVGFAAGMFIERAYINFSVKTKHLHTQLIKYALGLAGVLAIKEGLKLIIGISFAADIFRYFLMLTWVTVLFPLIIQRFFADNA